MNKKQIVGYTFRDVLGKELDLLSRLRRNASTTGSDREKLTGDQAGTKGVYDRAHEDNLTGLAFSGGGIRSATFNLGIIQALAKVWQKDATRGRTGLLSRFDYLSTVSGGGYIGSWLSAWLNRRAAEEENPAQRDGLTVVGKDAVDRLQARISTRPCGFGPEPENAGNGDAGDSEDPCSKLSGFEGNPRTSGFPPLEHAAIRYLRRYSNYLAPRVGLSGDTLAVVSLFLRNLILLQLALISLLVVLLLVPYCASAFSDLVIQSPEPEDGAFRTLSAGILLMFVALFTWRYAEGFPGKGRRRRMANPKWMATSIGLLIFAFWWLVVGSVRLYAGDGSIFLSEEPEIQAVQIAAIGTAGYLLAWLLGPNTLFLSRKEPGLEKIWRLVTAFFAALVFGFLTYLCTLMLPDTLEKAAGMVLPAVTLGPPLVLAVLSFTIAVHLGLARHLFNPQEREWWGRVGGFVVLASFIWLVVFAVALYGPPLFDWLENGGIALIAAWASASGVGAWLARNMSPGKTGTGAIVKNLVVKASPWLFIGGLALVVSYGLHLVLLAAFKPVEDIGFGQALAALLVAAAVFLVMTWRLDINIFSLHSLYRNRLVRAYLGASRSNERAPHPFTGFDLDDDLPLADLAQQRPIQILNTTLNMTGGDDLAWQTRRAASFAFTPHYVGYEAKSSQGTDLGKYRPTPEYGAHKSRKNRKGFSLGTVLAISGAAASPNMGYNTSAPVAALLTALNLRLGYWTGNTVLRNPDKAHTRFTPAWRKERSFLCARPIVSELTGSATAESDWINLSDGGHFDNLGIYELVRRRCRFIVATDAGCDPKHEFQDLANTIRKCWTDLGVHISFPDLERFSLEGKEQRFARSHGGFGLIEYPDRTRLLDEGDTNWERYGLILYLKCSLTRDEFDQFADIRQYASTNPSYPHQSTGDQFFDENQFEAYRHLGFAIAQQWRPKIRNLFRETADPDTGDTIVVFNEKKARKIMKKIMPSLSDD